MNTFDSRNEIRQLLPWYENGTLRGDERDAVHELLATDLEGNRQRRELRVLREVLADDPTLATNMVLNLGRLQSRLGPSRIAVPLTARWLAAAALVILAIGAVTFFAGMRLGSYHTLTAPSAAESVPMDAELIRVDVVAGVDAAALLRLAGDPQARVLHGPSEHGVATLAVPRDHAQQITARLSADPRLRFVAPVPR
jgi:hypothetical protein